MKFPSRKYREVTVGKSLDWCLDRIARKASLWSIKVTLHWGPAVWIAEGRRFRANGLSNAKALKWNA